LVLLFTTGLLINFFSYPLSFSYEDLSGIVRTFPSLCMNSIKRIVKTPREKISDLFVKLPEANYGAE